MFFLPFFCFFLLLFLAGSDDVVVVSPFTVVDVGAVVGLSGSEIERGEYGGGSHGQANPLPLVYLRVRSNVIVKLVSCGQLGKHIPNYQPLGT